jgi:hypothetical protein
MEQFANIIFIAFLLGLLSMLVCYFLIKIRTCIAEDEVLNAQKSWSAKVMDIGRAHSKKDRDYKKIAEKVIDDLYDFHNGTVLFKPTMAKEKQFRMTKEGALSYFIGGNAKYLEDKGFALNNWSNIKFENASIFIRGRTAIAMGNYFFTSLQGKIIKVEYTIGYKKRFNWSHPKIFLHHSSVPYLSKDIKM